MTRQMRSALMTMSFHATHADRDHLLVDDLLSL
jgi:hypothetical protein